MQSTRCRSVGLHAVHTCTDGQFIVVLRKKMWNCNFGSCTYNSAITQPLVRECARVVGFLFNHTTLSSAKSLKKSLCDFRGTFFLQLQAQIFFSFDTSSSFKICSGNAVLSCFFKFKMFGFPTANSNELVHCCPSSLEVHENTKAFSNFVNLNINGKIS